LAWSVVTGFVVVLGLLGMYFAGTAGLYAVVFVAVVLIFVGGVLTRGVRRIVRMARSRL
jgi:HAMP domain-containing protein